MTASFSPNGQCLAMGSANGTYSILRLGPLLCIDLLHELDVKQIPSWALQQGLYRSPYGPSYIMRNMMEGNLDSLRRVAFLLQEHPEAIYAFDRRADKGCFDTALELRQPNLLKLVLTAVVDGSLNSDKILHRRCILTTDIPTMGIQVLEEMVENYSPDLIVDVLGSMVFLKVPFTQERPVHDREIVECASPTYVDPFDHDDLKKHSLFTDMEENITKGCSLRTPAVLPLPGLGRMDFLQKLLVNAPPTVFDNLSMAVVLRVLWKDHIRKWFVLDFTLYAIFYVLWILLVDATSTTILASSLGMSAEDRKLYVLIVSAFTLVFNTLFAIKELVQSDYGRRRGYIKSAWNVIDLLSIACVAFYAVAVGFLDYFEHEREPLAVITTLLLTLVSEFVGQKFHINTD